jgi:hypothetical protein
MGRICMDDKKYVYVAVINGRAVVAFNVKADDAVEAELEAFAFTEKEHFQEDLAVLTTPDGQPLWDGVTGISVRPAHDDERAIWQKNRDDAQHKGDIDESDDYVVNLVPVIDSTGEP